MLRQIAYAEDVLVLEHQDEAEIEAALGNSEETTEALHFATVELQNANSELLDLNFQESAYVFETTYLE